MALAEDILFQQMRGMVMSMRRSTTQEARRRRVNLSVRDQAGQSATGATIFIIRNGRVLGSIEVGSTTAHRVEFDDGPLDLEVNFQGSSRSVSVTPGQDDYQIDLPGISRRHVIVVPSKAQCPDGTTGDPCVMCPGDVYICG